MSAEYPSRPKFWAAKFMRLMQKCCAANEIGVEACWLLTIIAQVEDSKRYSGPVTFWTGQILAVTGFQSYGRLRRARTRAIEAGWLHYDQGTKTSAASYWVTVPDHYRDVFDDAPIDEMDIHIGHENDNSNQMNVQNGQENDKSSADETQMKRNSNADETQIKRQHSIPTPNPIPNPNTSCVSGETTEAAADVEPPKPRAEYPQHFQRIWEIYPGERKREKRKALEKYRLSLRRMVSDRGLTDAEAQAAMLAAVKEYASSWLGQNYPAMPATWFHNDRWADDPQAWTERDKQNGQPVTTGPKTEFVDEFDF